MHMLYAHVHAQYVHVACACSHALKVAIIYQLSCDCFIDVTFFDGAAERQMGCSSSKSPEDVGATPNQPVDGEPGNAVKKGARIVILGAAAGSKYPRGRPATVLRACDPRRRPVLTSRGLRTVRIGYAYQPPAYLPAYRGTTGAGPAGLHMASRLKQLGCTNVTILERTFRYGGKTHTVHEYGNPNDIGTCWMHPGS